MDMAHKHSYRTTDIGYVGRVDGMCQPSNDGAYSLVRIADNTFKVPNGALEQFVSEFSAATETPSEPEDGE